MYAIHRERDVESSGRYVIEVDRLFHEEHVVALSEPREQLLWALPHEVPAQVAVDDDGRVRVFRGLGSKRARQSTNGVGPVRHRASALAARRRNGQTACLEGPFVCVYIRMMCMH